MGFDGAVCMTNVILPNETRKSSSSLSHLAMVGMKRHGKQPQGDYHVRHQTCLGKWGGAGRCCNKYQII